MPPGRRIPGAEAGLILFSGLSSLLILFLALPIIALYLGLKPSTLGGILGSPALREEVVGGFKVALLASAAAVALLLILGIPLAYLLARYNFPGKRVLEGLVDVPLALPHVVAGVMLLEAYGSRGLAGPLLERVHVVVEDHFLGVVLVMAFVSAPLLVDTVKVGFQAVPESLGAVARTLGASRLRAFRDIALPLAARSIAAGSLLAWARGLSEVGALLVVAYYPKTVNILILEYLSVYGLPYAVALSALYAALALGVFASLRVVARA
jgi:molybdate/tungstate transport system permease protein